MQLKSTDGPRAMLSRFTIKRVKYYAPNWLLASLFVVFWAKSGKTGN